MEQILRSTSSLLLGQESINKDLLDGLLGLNTGGTRLSDDIHVSILGVLVGDERLDVQISNLISGGHQVVVVDVLEERLESVDSLQIGGLRVGLGDLEGESLDTSNQGVGELVVLVTLIEGLDDKTLEASETTIQDNNNLTGLNTGYFKN